MGNFLQKNLSGNFFHRNFVLYVEREKSSKEFLESLQRNLFTRAFLLAVIHFPGVESSTLFETTLPFLIQGCVFVNTINRNGNAASFKLKQRAGSCYGK